jgi:hypothetical protein
VRRTTWATLVLLPALLAGCSTGAGSAGSGATDGAAAGGTADGDSWVVTDIGRATPSGKPTTGASPAPTPTGGFLPLPSVIPTRTPVSTCSPNTFKFNRMETLTARPGPTSAMLTWYNVGGANLVEFRLYAISQNLQRGGQRDVGYTVVKPTVQCGWMSAVIRGLDRRTDYVFSVDAVVKRRSGDGTHSATVARSGVTATS